MPRKVPKSAAQASFLQIDTKTAPCVPKIREEVAAWAAAGYQGVTKTSKTLLNYWFHTDHRLPDGRKFKYHPFQKEALETLVYIYEVAKKRSSKELIESYARVHSPQAGGSGGGLRLLQYDFFPRYALKMATGTGKTKVISLAVAWQYFNAVLENAQEYAATHLLIAPNVIVFERLKTDFAGGRVFKTDPDIPPALQIYWDFDCYVRGEGERASSQGALYLTNIQQLYERDENPNGDEVPIMSLMLGNKPPAQTVSVEPFNHRILARGGPVFIVNDEAHHTHDENSEWNQSIRRLHESLKSQVSPCKGGRKGGLV